MTHVGKCDQDNKSKWWIQATIISLCADKNCQSTQHEHMQPVKLAMTQSGHMQSLKPAMPQASHMRPVKVIDQSNHKKSQEKPVMAQSTHVQSMSKSARKQIGTQPEVARNSKHAVLPTHVSYVGPQLMLQDSTSKHCYPTVIKICVLIQEVTRCNLTMYHQ